MMADRPFASKSAREDQHKHNHKHQPETAAAIVTRAVKRASAHPAEAADKGNDENDEKDGSEGHCILFRSVISKGCREDSRKKRAALPARSTDHDARGDWGVRDRPGGIIMLQTSRQDCTGLLTSRFNLLRVPSPADRYSLEQWLPRCVNSWHPIIALSGKALSGGARADR